MRQAIWMWLTRWLTQRQILPGWALVAQWILFPLKTFHLKMGQSYGYQSMRDVWLIGGIEISERTLREMANSDGKIYIVRRDGNRVLFEEFIYGEFLKNRIEHDVKKNADVQGKNAVACAGYESEGQRNNVSFLGKP